MTRQQVEVILRKAGFKGEGLQNALRIVYAESRFNPKAYNPRGRDLSYGLFQINMRGDLGPDRRKRYGLKSNEALFNPLKNAKVAYQLSKGGTDFSPWSTWKVLSQESGGKQYSAALAAGADRDGVSTSQAALAYANALANNAQQNLVIGTGTAHNQNVRQDGVDTGRQSEHWTGNAVDIPAAGDALTKLGQQALITAGMPVAEALKQKGGVFNVNGYNILFNTDTGGNHYDHLHVGVGRATVAPVQENVSTVPSTLTPDKSVYGVQPYDPSMEVRADIPVGPGGVSAPGSAQIGAPQPRSPQETWQLILQQPYVAPQTQSVYPEGI